jgi:hypothetical protein
MKDVKSNPSVRGVSTINHALRLSLGLNCSEYVLADCIYDKMSRGLEVSLTTVHRKIGFSADEVKHTYLKLLDKGIVIGDFGNKTIEFTQKYIAYFQDIEKEFEEFWTIIHGVGEVSRRNAWPGSKPKALQEYIRVRKVESKEYLLEQRDQYFRYLEWEQKRGFNRQKMMAVAFLNTDERYKEDWKSQADEIAKNYKTEDIVMASTMTADSKKELYGKDTDQQGTD